jgi:phosphoribosylanthranilate isomerase
MSVKVKICGLTNSADMMAAVEGGADALGFIFHEPSPRHISIAAAAKMVRDLPPFIIRVGVFVNAPEDTVLRAVGECGLTLLQFHGDEPPEFCLGFGVMSMKAFRMRDAASLDLLAQYPTDAWLLDSYLADKLGGTGATFNWDLARQAKGRGRPIFLAGGLTPENVAEAVRQVGPFGVDVSSGVEASQGKKDLEKLRAFIREAKAAAG